MNKKIGVVHGGVSPERDKSIEYGKKVKRVLEELGMQVVDLHQHPNGSWTVDGKVENLPESIKKIDAVWNCLVGTDGESGLLENICSDCKTKVLGHGVLHTGLANNKKNMKLAAEQHKIKSPYGKIISKDSYSPERVLEMFASVGIPAIVKPVSGSSMVGVFLVNNFTELEQAIETLIEKGQDVLVEKVITGIPVSCFVLEHNNIFHTSINSHDNSENGGVILNKEDMLEVRNTALFIHNVLAFPHHSEYDFILNEKKGEKKLYFLEANTHPAVIVGYINKIFTEGNVSLKDYISGKINNL